MRFIFIFILYLPALNCSAQAQEVLYPKLQQDLITLKKVDQDALSKGTLSKQELIDLQTGNTAKLKDMVLEYGWPSISKVGASASQGAWLLVQHADNDRVWQREALSMMEALMASADVDKSNIAYLRDRLSIADNNTQLYGSQGKCIAKNTWQPFPIVKEDEVEIRRAKMDMSTLPEYVSRASNMCKNYVAK